MGDGVTTFAAPSSREKFPVRRKEPPKKFFNMSNFTPRAGVWQAGAMGRCPFPGRHATARGSGHPEETIIFFYEIMSPFAQRERRARGCCMPSVRWCRTWPIVPMCSAPTKKAMRTAGGNFGVMLEGRARAAKKVILCAEEDRLARGDRPF